MAAPIPQMLKYSIVCNLLKVPPILIKLVSKFIVGKVLYFKAQYVLRLRSLLKHIMTSSWAASVAQLDAHPTGDQVTGSTPAGSTTFFRADLIMKYFIFYGHPLPSADSRRTVVSFWRKNVHTSTNATLKKTCRTNVDATSWVFAGRSDGRQGAKTSSDERRRSWSTRVFAGRTCNLVGNPVPRLIMNIKYPDHTLQNMQGESQQTHNVYTTSSQRRCNVMTLHRRWDDVV